MSAEQNEKLCTTGGSTPMGAVLRRYWTPVAVAADVSASDGDPLAVEVFGDRFVLFRDSNGHLGLLERGCVHRGASLALGRNERCGLRCLYHGWKFDVGGSVVETPNLAGGRTARLHQPAYPVVEAGGLIWGYFGPGDLEPPLPRYHWVDKIASGRDFLARQIVVDCNWMQLIEGVLDSSHLEMLHRDEMALAQGGALDGVATLSDRFPAGTDAPTLDVETTDFGYHYAAFRGATTTGSRHVRVTSWIAPSTVMIAPGNTTVIYVPVNDTTTAFYNVTIAEDGQQLDRNAARRYTGVGEPGVGPWGADRRFIPPAQDREAMRRGESFTGIEGITWQDALVNLSQGPIYDRTKEHLTPSDAAIARMRHLLLDAADQVAAGLPPVGLARPVDYGAIDAPRGMVAAGERWQDLRTDENTSAAHIGAGT